jgi:hypothetical protein
MDAVLEHSHAEAARRCFMLGITALNFLVSFAWANVDQQYLSTNETRGSRKWMFDRMLSDSLEGGE